MSLGPATAVSQERSGLSWAAAFGGAAVATAVTVMLLALGAGIGLGAVSPDSSTNPSAASFTALAAVWLIVVQWVSSFFGGYLAGRLRPGWTGLHASEAMFRDTATGFVAWAVATLLIVVVASSGVGSALGGAGRALAVTAGSAAGGAGSAAGGTGSAASPGAASGALLDALFRPTTPNPQEDSAASHAEAGRLLASAATGDLSQPDHDYLVQVVAARTGLAPADAGKRVDDVIAREHTLVQHAKDAANAALKAASRFAVFTFFSMLIGAFIACVAAAIGGRQRDAL